MNISPKLIGTSLGKRSHGVMDIAVSSHLLHFDRPEFKTNSFFSSFRDRDRVSV